MTNFAAVDYPIDIISLNASNQALAETICYNVGQWINKDINPDLCIITHRNNNTYPYYFWYPGEALGYDTQSSITVTGRYDDHITLTTTNWYRATIYANGTVSTGTSFSRQNLGSLYYDPTNGTSGLVYNTHYPFTYNQVDTFITSIDDIQVPDGLSIGMNNFGSLGSGGHSTGSPHSAITNGISWGGITGSLSTSGHSTSVSPSSSTFDFTDPEQNLLGQIVDNTNTLIGHTSSLWGAIQTLNNNVITGASAIFNALSTINDNIISLTVYDEEKVDNAWQDSYAKKFFDGATTMAGQVETTINGYKDHFFQGAGPSELEIPLDFTVWEFSSDDYGDFAPFDQVYYMRFPFLDETKALWQPILLGLMYFALVSTIFFDFPNILRGAVK